MIGHWLDDFKFNYKDFLLGSFLNDKINLIETDFPLDKLPTTTQVNLDIDGVNVLGDESSGTQNITHAPYSALVAKFNFTATQTPAVLRANPTGRRSYTC